jgi:hypothetical protein
LNDEIEEHLALQTEENLRTGLAPFEACRQALLKFGAVESIKEDYRDERRLPYLETLLREMRHAIRQLRKFPGFALIASRSLASALARISAFSASPMR